MHSDYTPSDTDTSDSHYEYGGNPNQQVLRKKLVRLQRLELVAVEEVISRPLN